MSSSSSKHILSSSLSGSSSNPRHVNTALPELRWLPHQYRYLLLQRDGGLCLLLPKPVMSGHDGMRRRNRCGDDAWHVYRGQF